MRDKRIDVLKGIGILFMVYRHAYAPFSDYLVLFHMAVFFIASGLLFKTESVNTFSGLIGYIKRKLMHLWIPYFIFTCLFILLNNFFIHVGFYTMNPDFLRRADGLYIKLAEIYDFKAILIYIIKAFFMRASMEMGGALWFFQTLLYVTVAYGTIEFLLIVANKKIKTIKPILCQAALAIAFLLMGWFCSAKKISFWGLDRLFSCYILFFIGQIIKRYRKTFEKLVEGKLAIVLFAAGIILTVLLRKFGFVAIDRNIYPNPLFFVVASVVGWILYFTAANFVLTHFSFAAKLLQNVSRRSVFIVALHFVAFKLVNVFYVWIVHEEKYMIASFPVVTKTGAWWIMYVLLGVVLPMIVAYAYEFSKKRIMKLVWGDK